jgi:hypothetical protein
MMLSIIMNYAAKFARFSWTFSKQWVRCAVSIVTAAVCYPSQAHSVRHGAAETRLLPSLSDRRIGRSAAT